MRLRRSESIANFVVASNWGRSQFRTTMVAAASRVNVRRQGRRAFVMKPKVARSEPQRVTGYLGWCPPNAERKLSRSESPAALVKGAAGRCKVSAERWVCAMTLRGLTQGSTLLA